MGRGLVLAGVVLAVCVIALGGCGSKVTKDNFDKVKDGMSVADVEGLLGKGEKASAGISVPGLTVTGEVTQWKDGDKQITVVFKDGKVVGKANKGL